MTVTLYTHDSGLRHDTPDGHPERADRLRTLMALFNEKPFSDFPRGTIKPATEEQLLYGHRFDYIEKVRHAIPQEGRRALDSDTIVSVDSLEAAFYAAGAPCSAVDDIAAGKTRRAFCAMRPPGHHAEAAVARGFCLFNNIFLGARHAQEAHGFGKIAIVDFDVHQGNGTDKMTRAHDGSILYISTHQGGIFPNEGFEGDNEECVMNFELATGSGSKTFRSLYEQKVFPALTRFAPELLMISAGFDAHKDDPLANLMLESEDFGWVTQKLCAIADATAQGRIVSVLEGGYHLEALKTSATSHLRALADLPDLATP
ncbi:MAG: acetoin utilization protein [Micavibrio aeruginosavorus]|uniref:Acetoin utilization protein n=1 Tax=Micavibrio aeruginosavorus TaxID=349221 RepID=A0A2W5MUR3_9BACT|nr:MAG: acetoin utilization protein [Micavibrio aeruginosavorus]